MSSNKIKHKYVCKECGHEELKWCGRCPGCGSWNTMSEELNVKQVTRGIPRHKEIKPTPLNKIEDRPGISFATGISELDRVLGNGIVPGSLLLFGGDPGIGKSTLALQAITNIADTYGLCLYVTGEESVRQIKMRASRLGVLTENVYIVTETSIEQIIKHAEKYKPKLIVVDSIQTVFSAEIPSAPGSVAQIRECAGLLMNFSKTEEIPVIIIGHVTKEGFLAGPRVLEHIVDTVLYFEGERHHSFRILRAVKNRFGSTNEIGVFEMGETGLEEVSNPSQLFLAERPAGASGSVVICGIEGTRPVLVEVQALVTPSSFGNARRMTRGIDYNRVNLVAAVLEKKVGLRLGNQDVYLNIAGGIRLDEPAVDLGVAVALASSLRDITVDPCTVVVGEIGLTGEVRGISHVSRRINEGTKLGFNNFIIPKANLTRLKIDSKANVTGVRRIEEAFELALGVNL